jgi:hypothetical protein
MRALNHNTKNKSAACNEALEVLTEVTLISVVFLGVKPYNSVDAFESENDFHTLNTETASFF